MSNKKFPQIEPFLKFIPREQDRFYEILNNIANRLQIEDSDTSFTKRYLDKEKIPRLLQTQNNSQAVFIKSFRTPCESIKFPKINPNDCKIIKIHVTQGVLEIIKDEISETLFAPKSCLVNLNMCDIYARVLKTTTNFVIIIQNKFRNNYVFNKPLKHHAPTRFVVNNIKITSLPDDIQPLPTPFNKNPISYIRAKVTEKDLIDRIVFMDAEFVRCNDRMAPASVTIINYDGLTVFNKIIKPRDEVIDYVKFITGFNKQILENGMPEDDALDIINKILVGKILVGSDLTLDIKYLEIRIGDLLGIRDLSTALVLQDKLEIYDHRISLRDMVKYFWNIPIHKGVHTSLEDAKYIREVYLKIKDIYEDDFYIADEDDKNKKEQETVIIENNSICIDLTQDTTESENINVPENTFDNLDGYDLESISDNGITLHDESDEEYDTANSDDEDCEMVNLDIPKRIKSKNGEFLKFKYIVYANENKSSKRNKLKTKTIGKFIPPKLQI